MVWETDTDNEEEQAPSKAPPTLGFVVKTYLALVASDHMTWGIVEDTLNDLLWEPGKGELVGSWSKAPYDNLIHISLCTSISALQDRSIQIFAKYAEERKQKALGIHKTGVAKPKKARSTSEPEQPEVLAGELSIDEKLKFNSLRAKLGRAK